MLNKKNNLSIFEYLGQIIEEQHPEMAGYKWNEDCMYRLPYDPITKEKV
jgi:hypothetical protein